MANFGGNVDTRQVSSIISSNASKYKLNYSHKKENRWNMWRTNSGMTLSFVLNNGLFIPSISGTSKKTLTKFYNSNGSDVDAWVKSSISTYFDTILEARQAQVELVEEARPKPQTEEEYWREFYSKIRQSDSQLEFLSDEEIESMYHYRAQLEDLQQPVKQMKRTRKRKEC